MTTAIMIPHPTTYHDLRKEFKSQTFKNPAHNPVDYAYWLEQKILKLLQDKQMHL